MTQKIVLKNQKRWGEDVFSLLSWFDMERVRKSSVMVVGAGALGNEVLKNLALFGVGHLVVVDFDYVEYSNLSRSVLFRESDVGQKLSKAVVTAKRIREINPEVQVMAIHGDVGPDVGLGVFRDMDVVIGCLDSRYARYLLNQHCFRANKPWVDGGIENLEGYVRIFRPGKNCYECSLTDEELQHIARRTGCPDIAKINLASGRIATTPISASIIGAIQVQEALKIIHERHLSGTSYKTLDGKLFKYDGMFMTVNTFGMSCYNKDCTSHELWEPVLRAETLGQKTPVGEALAIIKDVTASNNPVINLKNNMFIEKIIPESTEEELQTLLPESRIADFLELRNLGFNPTERIFQEFIENIGDDFPHKHLRLGDIGVPSYDIIQVSTSRGISYVELTADKPHMSF